MRCATAARDLVLRIGDLICWQIGRLVAGWRFDLRLGLVLDGGFRLWLNRVCLSVTRIFYRSLKTSEFDVTAVKPIGAPNPVELPSQSFQYLLPLAVTFACPER